MNRSTPPLTALVILAVASATAVYGQENPCPEVYSTPRVGHYADLLFSSDEAGEMEVHFAVVGSEVLAGKTYYWLEIVSTPPMASAPIIAQMLVPHYPFEMSDIKGYIVKMPGQPAIKMSQQMIEQLDAGPVGPGWRDQCQRALDLGVEQITVRAGTFTARHYRAAGGDASEVWIADVPFGMVKMVQADGTMELLRFGSDAQNSIRETPLELPSNPPRNP